jgi:hypothetical protein
MLTTNEVRRLLKAHQQEVGHWLTSPHLDTHIETLQAAASGKVNDSDAIDEAYDFVMKALHGNAWNGDAVDDSFWQSDIGQTMQRVRFLLEADSLITISEAAKMLYDDNSQAARMRVQRIISQSRTQPARTCEP